MSTVFISTRATNCRECKHCDQNKFNPDDVKSTYCNSIRGWQPENILGYWVECGRFEQLNKDWDI